MNGRIQPHWVIFGQNGFPAITRSGGVHQADLRSRARCRIIRWHRHASGRAGRGAASGRASTSPRVHSASRRSSGSQRPTKRPPDIVNRHPNSPVCRLDVRLRAGRGIATGGPTRLPLPLHRYRTRYTSGDEVCAGIRDLRSQRELRGRQGAAALAADGDQLRPSRDARGAGNRRRPATPAPCATRSTACRRTTIRQVTYDGTYEDLFFYVERLVIAGLRRRRRGPPAHGALAQRHRHDDVPDAAAGAGPRPDRRDASSCAGRCSTSPTGTATPSSPLHTHTQRAQPSTVAHYLLAVIEQLERDGGG